MAALDFPSSPTNGQTYTSGTRTWTYDSSSGTWRSGYNSNSVLTAAQITDLEDNTQPTGASGDNIFYENELLVTASYTLTTSKNAVSVGPITVNSGVTVTVPTGQKWVVL